MSNGYTPSAARIVYEGSELFWDDWQREYDIKAALKIATPEDAAVLTEALKPIAERQDAYWNERDIERGIDQTALKLRNDAFSKKCADEKRPSVTKFETR